MALCVSCSDDDGDGINLSNLTGTWKLTIEEGCEDGETFYEDHSYTYHYLAFKENAICIKCSKDEYSKKWDYSQTYSYSIDEATKSLIIDKGVNTEVYEIMSLSSKELKMEDISFKDSYREGDWMYLTYHKVSDGDLHEDEN